MITLENETLKASVHPMGGELHSLYHKNFGIEYLWNGNPEFWPRHSPVLFPIVGGLKDDFFVYKGEKYQLPKHGFARDMEFKIEKTWADSASFTLASNEETFKSYPFNFLLRISYKLDLNKITISYEVENPAEETLYFSIGTHPAFNIPLVEGTRYNDYFLEFSEEENSDRHIVKDNMLNETLPYLQNQKTLPLEESLFYSDALVFTDLKSVTIALKSNKHGHGLNCNFAGFPYMGIWAARNAPFVCIEPWCGITDTKDHNQKIEEKEGIISLSEGNRWSKSWSVDCF